MQLISGLTLVLMTITGRIAALPAAGGQNGLEGIPVGSADGIYVGSLKDDGSTHWQYHGPIQEPIEPLTAPSNSSASDSELVKRDSVNCNGWAIDSNYVSRVSAQFSSACGDGYTFKSRAISIKYGSVVAYGCDYGNGQTCYSWNIDSFFSQISDQCGGDGAGWYSIPNWKAAYGRTYVGDGFC